MDHKCAASKEYNLKIGSSTRKWRHIKGIKQKHLARLLHLSAAAVSNIENDITVPSLRQVEDIARCLDISIEMLLYGPEQLINKYQEKRLGAAE
jgi:transcriptional regulator with XRE-family HTH domain